MGDIYQDRETMTQIAIHKAKEHGCNYNIILFNPVDGEFGEGSTYEFVADSYFNKERPNAILLDKTDDLIPKEANEGKSVGVLDGRKFDGFDEALARLDEESKKTSFMDFEITNPYPHMIPRARTSPVVKEPKVHRNSICPKCDSGKKFKNCCMKNG